MFNKSTFPTLIKRIPILAIVTLLWGISPGKAMLDEEHPEFSYTQTMGYIKAHLGDNFTEINPESPLEGIKENLCKFYQFIRSKDYLMIRTDRNHPNIIPVGEALLEEHYSPERDFAYQGANPTIGLLYDAYREIRCQLMNLQRDDLFICRGTDQVFSGLHNVADFINEQLRKQNKKSFRHLQNYNADFAEKGLSVNFFLVGNCGTAFDDTMQFFIEGASDRDIRLKRSLVKLFTYLGLDMTKTEEIESLIDEFEALPLLDRGRLFQFSYARGFIDEFYYLSKSLGNGVTIDGSEDYDITKKQVATLLHGIRKDPQKVKQFSEEIAYYDEGIPTKYFELSTIQGRYLPHPKLCCENSPQEVRTYWRGLSRNAPEVLEYKQLLKGLVGKVVFKVQQSKVVLPKATFLTFGPEGIPEKIEDQEATISCLSDHLLSAYICSGDLKQLSQIFMSTNLMDINRCIIDINDLEDQTDHSPLYLSIKYDHPEVVDFLLSNGARIENEPADRRNLLGWASMNGYPSIVQQLMDTGCDPNATFRARLLSKPIVTLAQEYGHREIVESLWTHKDFVFTETLSKQLMKGILKTQNNDRIRTFFEKVKADRFTYGKALKRAIKREDTVFVKIVLEAIGVPLKRSFLLTTPIIQAIDQENLSIIQLLIESGADLTKKYSYYGTPLERAQKTQNSAVIEFIQSNLNSYKENSI